MKKFIPKLICFDLDNTLIKGRSWKNLNLALGVTLKENNSYYNAYKDGVLNYLEWRKRLEKLYKKRGLATKQRVLEAISNFSYNQGAKETVNYLRQKGYRLCILSGAISVLVERVANELKIPLWSTNNVFKFDRANRLKRFLCLGDEEDFKLKMLKKYCRTYKIGVTESLFVGDEENEIPIFQACKHGVTFRGLKVEKYAWKVIDILTDLKEII